VLKYITDLIVTRVGAKTTDSDEGYLRLILYVAAGYSAFVHTLLLLFFVVATIPVMVVVNVVSILIYATCALLTYHRHYTAAGLLLSFEIIIFAIITMLLTGFYTYVIFYFVLVLILQMIIPYGRPWIRAVISALIIALLLYQVHFEIGYQPLYSLGDYRVAFSSLNISISLFAVAAELFVSTYIKGVIAHLGALREAELESLAHTDALTGLYNRRYAECYFERIKKEEPQRDWCVAMLDIDFFKNINDDYGHAVGDIALVELAQFLRRRLRSSDVIFRWGGEEFLILLSTRNRDVAVMVLEKVREGIAALRTTTDTLCFKFTVTIGVAPLDLDRVDECIATCDAKLYQGKEAGRNRVVC
jgi:diguanylate cyclase (GGDEF)-like protein